MFRVSRGLTSTAAAASILGAVASQVYANQQVQQVPLPGASIPKYVEAVPQPVRVTANSFDLTVREAIQQAVAEFNK